MATPPPSDPDLPPLSPQQNPALVQSPSPADPSSEDPISRSVASGSLSPDTDTSLPHSQTHVDNNASPKANPNANNPILNTSVPSKSNPHSPSHNRTSSTALRGNTGSALSVLDLLRGRGVLPSDDEDEDEEMNESPFFASSGGGRMGPLGALRAPQGNRAQDLRREVRVLHPYATTLGPGDMEAVIRLESACFPEGERASNERIRYRMSVAGELSLGLFSSVVDAEAEREDAKKVLASPAAEVGRRVEVPGVGDEGTVKGRRLVLLAAVVATKSRNALVREGDLEVPGENAGLEGARQGHDEAGRTIILHSVTVAPEFQRLGLGRIVLKSYIQRIQEADVADRIAILTYQRLMPFYSRLGFEEKGKSDLKVSGRGWRNMVLAFEGKKGEDD